MIKQVVILVVVFASYFYLGMQDTWAQATGDKPQIQKVSQQVYEVTSPQQLKDELKSQNLPPDTKFYINLKSEKNPFVKFEPIIGIKEFLKSISNQNMHTIIVITRTVFLTGIAVTVTYTDQTFDLAITNGLLNSVFDFIVQNNVAVAYGSTTALMQALLGHYNELELRYLAHKVKLQLDKLKEFKLPLRIDDTEESRRVAQLAKWILLELTFLTAIETSKALADTNISFSLSHILREVFLIGAMTTYFQEPLDSLNSIYTRRKNKILKQQQVDLRDIYFNLNMGNVRTAMISVTSVAMGFMYLNPTSQLTQTFPIDISLFLLGAGSVAHTVNITYKHHLYKKQGWQTLQQTIKQKSDQIFLNIHSSRQCSAFFGN